MIATRHIVLALSLPLLACAATRSNPGEPRSTDCREIVPAVMDFVRAGSELPTFYACGGRVWDSAGASSEADRDRRCEADGCRIWEVVFEQDGNVKLRRVRRFPSTFPFPPGFVELHPRWGRRDGTLLHRQRGRGRAHLSAIGPSSFDSAAASRRLRSG
ncbi:MAG: hypothetical protein QM704_03075 [Anaeromyxobacteraceae bacterium]